MSLSVCLNPTHPLSSSPSRPPQASAAPIPAAQVNPPDPSLPSWLQGASVHVSLARKRLQGHGRQSGPCPASSPAPAPGLIYKGANSKWSSLVVSPRCDFQLGEPPDKPLPSLRGREAIKSQRQQVSWRLAELHAATKGGARLNTGSPGDSWLCPDLCSNRGFFQGNMEQRLLGISVSEKEAGLGLEKVAFDLCSGVMGTQVFGV